MQNLMNIEPELRHVACGFSHSIICSDSGIVYSCGEGTHGEIGNERFRVTPCLDMVNSGADNDGTDACGGKRIVHVACGAHHTVIMTADGFLYTFGDTSRGALGHGPSDNYRAVDGTRRANNIPMLNRWLLGFDYDPGTNFDVASTSRLPVSVTHASAGDGFSVIVDQHGRVWAWGSNLYGNLGLGDTVSRSFPAQLEALSDIKEVHAGAEHVVAISLQGSCYTWGHGVGGRLGRGDVYDSAIPAIVGHLNSVFVVTGDAGDAHSAVISDGGTLFTWGSGAFGRLGHGDELDCHHPKKVSMQIKQVLDQQKSGDGKKNVRGSDEVQDGEGKSTAEATSSLLSVQNDQIVSVSCGTTNTLAVAASGRLYAFGGGLFGKLGLGDEKNRLNPHVVDTGGISKNNEQVVEVSCGAFHTICLTKSGCVYGWGFGGTLNSRLGLGEERTGDPKSQPASHSRFLVPTQINKFPDRARFLEEQDTRMLGFPARHLSFSGSEFDPQSVQMQGAQNQGNDSGMNVLTGNSGESKGDQDADDPEMAALAQLTAVLPPSTIIKVACGRHHTLFLSLGGQLFAAGENEWGQLGLNSTMDTNIPRLVRFPNSTLGRERLADIACGGNHSLALTARGVAFSWGKVSIIDMILIC